MGRRLEIILNHILSWQLNQNHLIFVNRFKVCTKVS